MPRRNNRRKFISWTLIFFWTVDGLEGASLYINPNVKWFLSKITKRDADFD